MNSPQQGGRRGAISVAAVAALLLVAGIAVLAAGLRGPGTTGTSQAAPEAATSSVTASPSARTRPESPPRKRDTDTKAPDSTGSGTERTVFGPTLEGSAPVGLSIPRIDVSADTFESLALADNAEIEVPQDPQSPGWFTPGPSPGQLGPAVIAGHVDSASGPAVFYRLGELRAGDRVRVAREDGSTATFAVDRVETYEKDRFPTRAVYGTTQRAELRLITCSGQFDSEDGYLSNTVVYAHLVPGSA